jgi:hypothetical protein
VIEEEPDTCRVNAFDQDEPSLLRDADFEIWSPYDAADAAEALLALLNEDTPEE